MNPAAAKPRDRVVGGMTALRTISLGFLIGVLFVLSSVATARAEDVRVPSKGDPAYAFTVPSGWTTSYDQSGGVSLMGKACGCAISLSVVDVNTAEISSSEFAVEFFKGVGAIPYTRTDTGEISGIPGAAFFSKMKRAGAPNLKFVIVKVDPSHYATLTVITPPALSDRQTVALNALLAKVRLTVARPEEVRIPATGDPAYAFTVPAEWRTKYDAVGNLILNASSCACGVSLTVANINASVTTAQFSALVLKTAGADPNARSEPGSIAGIPGDAFITTMNQSGTVLNFKLVLVRLDPSHLASMVVLTQTSAAPSSLAVLDALLAQIHFTSAHAVDVRIPANGDPAFAFTVSPTWTVKYDDLGPLTMKNASCGCAVVLNVEAADTTSITPAQVAANGLKVMGAPPSSTTAPATLGGIQGDAYFSTMNNPNGGLFNVKIVIVKLGLTHYAEMVLVTPPQLSPAAAADVDSVVGQIGFTGLAK